MLFSVFVPYPTALHVHSQLINALEVNQFIPKIPVPGDLVKNLYKCHYAVAWGLLSPHSRLPQLTLTTPPFPATLEQTYLIPSLSPHVHFYSILMYMQLLESYWSKILKCFPLIDCLDPHFKQWQKPPSYASSCPVGFGSSQSRSESLLLRIRFLIDMPLVQTLQNRLEVERIICLHAFLSWNLLCREPWLSEWTQWCLHMISGHQWWGWEIHPQCRQSCASICFQYFPPSPPCLVPGLQIGNTSLLMFAGHGTTISLLCTS